MRSIKRFLPSRSIVAAVIVSLVVGGVGSATAASLITGDQIKDGSIQYNDLSKKAKKKLRGKRGQTGATGAAGTQGAEGDKGDTGAAGSARAWATVRSGTAGFDGLHPGISAVSRPATGIYCLTTDPPIDPTGYAAAVSQEYGWSSTVNGHAELRIRDYGSCPAGDFQVETFDSSATHDNGVSFTILIP